MKLFCKRGVSLLLALLILAGLLSGLSVGASAAGASVEERGKQAVAVALAYFDKGHSVQYGGKTINSGIKRTDGGATRSTNMASPEYATPHETLYTVCSDFAHQVYWEAFHYDLLNKGPGYIYTGTLSNPLTDPATVVWSYEPYSTPTNPTAQIAEMYAMAQPGDVFTAFSMKLIDGELSPVGGHTMVWAGDVTGDGRPDIIHSGGRHMNVDLQIDRREYYDENDPDYIKDRDYYCSTDPDFSSTDTPEYFHDYCANFGASTNGGTIRIADAQEYIDARYVKRGRRMTLRRPALAMTEESHPILASSQYRVTHPGLTIDRTLVDKTRFISAYPGETVTMSLVLSNNSDRHVGFVSGSDDEDFDDSTEETTATVLAAAPQSAGANATVLSAGNTPAAADVTATLQSGGESYTVTVSEKTPVGAKLKTQVEGSRVIGNTMSWEVELAPGEKKEFTFEYEITADCGEKVIFDGGFVGDIPSNSIPIQVGGKKLTTADTAKLAAIADGTYNRFLSDEGANNNTLADVVYRKLLGINAEIPTFQQVISSSTKTTKVASGNTTRLFRSEDEITTENMNIYRMLVPTCWGGMGIWGRYGSDRCSDPRNMHLEPGDIVVRSNNLAVPANGAEQLIYLGEGKYLSYDEENNGYPIVNEREFFRCLYYGAFYVLRPTLVYGDLPGRASVTVEDCDIKPGQTGTVTLKLDQNSGIAGARLKLHYDPTLKLEKIEKGDALPGLTFTPPGSLSENPVSLLWDGMEADSTCGTLLTLTFSVPEDAKDGKYDVSLSYATGDIYDGSTNDVYLSVESGRVTVRGLSVGDVNDDGRINAKDVTALRRYLAGGFGVTLNPTIADANGDGVINAKDVTILRRYIAGGYGVDLGRDEVQLKPDETPRIPLP